MEQIRKDKTLVMQGFRDGIPIGLGYLAVSFALGITARNAGLNAFQGFLCSLLNNASAGEYAGFACIAANATYLEIALMILTANARYLLMSCSLSQKFSPDTPFYHRLIIGFDVTDELFGLAIAQRGFLKPAYQYGAMITPLIGWSVGTALGIVAGNLLPPLIVDALSVAVFGMFLYTIIPPCRHSRVVAGCVAVSFLLSFFSTKLTLPISESLRTILLTVGISAAAALLFPVRNSEEEAE